MSNSVRHKTNRLTRAKMKAKQSNMRRNATNLKKST
jgi:hypothetical protein